MGLTPAIGHATVSVELQRVVGYRRTGHEGANSCYVDAETEAGVSTLVEGEIRGWSDLEAAESGLQALLFHDRIDVLRPAFLWSPSSAWLPEWAKMTLPGIFLCQHDERTELSVRVFATCDPVDLQYSIESLFHDTDRVVSSSLEGSNLVGRTPKEVQDALLANSLHLAAAISALPLEMSVPAYLSHPNLDGTGGVGGFFGELYSRVRPGWEAALEAVPNVDFNLRLPPLVAVLLDRAPTRDQIPETIQELREELCPVREELVGFSDLVRGALTEKQLEARCREIISSFDAIVPASRWENAPVFSLLRLYKVVKSPLDWLLQATNPNYVTNEPRRVAVRTHSGRVLAPLMRTDSMHSLTTHFFTAAEVANLVRDAGRRSER